MQMQMKETLKEIKKYNFSEPDVQLISIKTYLRNRKQHYILKFVPLDNKLKSRLRTLFKDIVNSSNSAALYEVDSAENEPGEVFIAAYEESDFKEIIEKLKVINLESDTISEAKELNDAKAYMVVFTKNKKIIAVGYKKIPESWRLKEKKGIFSVLFQNNRFEDLDAKPVFSISQKLDFIYFKEEILILSKKGYEIALNIRLGMLRKAEEFYQEVEKMNLFTDLQTLKLQISDNSRLLRRVSQIFNTGYYRDPAFLQKLKEISEKREWGIKFEGNKIIITSENVEVVLTLLSNRRLLSEITGETFDVEHARKIQ